MRYLIIILFCLCLLGCRKIPTEPDYLVLDKTLVFEFSNEFSGETFTSYLVIEKGTKVYYRK